MMKPISLGGSFTFGNTSLAVNRMGYGRVGVRSKAGKLPRWRRDRSVLEWLDSL